MRTLKSITITENEVGALDVATDPTEEGAKVNMVEVSLWLQFALQKINQQIAEKTQSIINPQSMRGGPRRMN